MNKKAGATLAAAPHKANLSPYARQALKAAGAGIITGGAAGATIGGSIGIAALGTAVGVPLVAVGAVLGLGVAGLWSLLFGGSARKRITEAHAEIEALAYRNHALSQLLLDSMAENNDLKAGNKKLRTRVRKAETELKAYRDHFGPLPKSPEE